MQHVYFNHVACLKKHLNDCFQTLGRKKNSISMIF